MHTTRGEDNSELEVFHSVCYTWSCLIFTLVWMLSSPVRRQGCSALTCKVRFSASISRLWFARLAGYAGVFAGIILNHANGTLPLRASCIKTLNVTQQQLWATLSAIDPSNHKYILGFWKMSPHVFFTAGPEVSLTGWGFADWQAAQVLASLLFVIRQMSHFQPPVQQKYIYDLTLTLQTDRSEQTDRANGMT